MNNNHGKKIVLNKDKKDVFSAYLLEGIQFDGFFDIPVIRKESDIEVPSKLIAYSKINTIKDEKYVYCHFYQDDYKFDGMYGVWNSLLYNHQFKKGFHLEKFANVYAIITPDYSLYGDMPRATQINNVFRSRTVGAFLQKLGYHVVINVRWTDEFSYTYCFDGIEPDSIVAVSTLGCLRANMDRKLFIEGFKELIRRIHPQMIILYGTLSDEIKRILKNNHQKYVYFPSQISETMVKKNGNESK